MDALFFTFKISPDSPHIGSGKLDGKGIPPDFFTDPYVRIGIAHLIDFPTYLKDAWEGEAKQLGSPFIEGLLGYDPGEPKYFYDPKRAAEMLKKAWGGKLWEVGMELIIFYNVGNVMRKVASDMPMCELAKINPKVQGKGSGNALACLSQGL